VGELAAVPDPLGQIRRHLPTIVDGLTQDMQRNDLAL
jgi:hypothetical protein